MNHNNPSIGRGMPHQHQYDAGAMYSSQPIQSLSAGDNLILTSDFVKPGWIDLKDVNMTHRFNETLIAVKGKDLDQAVAEFRILAKLLEAEDYLVSVDEIGRSRNLIVRAPDFAFVLELGPSEDKNGTFYIGRLEKAYGTVDAGISLTKWAQENTYEMAHEGSRLDVDGDRIEQVTILDIVRTEEGLNAVPKHTDTSEFKDVKHFYYPKIDTTLMVQQYLKIKANLLLLTGQPGTGKTSLMRRIIAETAIAKGKAITAVYVKDPSIIAEQQFFTMMESNNPDILLLDDFDEGLGQRKVGNDDTSIVSNLNSFCNGVFKSDTKVIITTNMELEDVDDALVRDGRCFDILDIPKLEWAEALDIWLNHLGHPKERFIKHFGTDVNIKISQALLAVKSEIVSNFNDQGYLLDPSISLRDKYIKDEE